MLPCISWASVKNMHAHLSYTNTNEVLSCGLRKVLYPVLGCVCVLMPDGGGRAKGHRTVLNCSEQGS